MERRFVVARNPDPVSTLPFLLWLPVSAEGLVLRAKDSWPRTAKVFCFRAGDDEWHPGLEIVDDVAVQTCERRGVAIDLVLDRRQEHRSQFVFTRLKDGREAIFWQSARTARSSRPGVRIPGRRASSLRELTITIDTRERYPYRFAAQQTDTVRAALPVGDYGVVVDGVPVALVERKSLVDLAKGLNDGGLSFQMSELSGHPRAAVVVEDRYSSVFKHPHMPAGVMADLLARLQIRYPSVPIVFCDTRPLAEEWTFRFLGAALVAHLDEPSDPAAPKEWVD
jgi:hypothetical protein